MIVGFPPAFNRQAFPRGHSVVPAGGHVPGRIQEEPDIPPERPGVGVLKLPRAPWIRRVAFPSAAQYTRAVSMIERSYRYIVRTPGVRSGNARIEGTRVAVHDVIGLLQTGETVDSLIARCSPELTRAQVYESLAYYEDHRGEIDVLVARQMSPADS